MEFSPQSVANKSFDIVKKGFEPVAVKKYLVELAAAIEASQNESAAMEARARAAVSRLQELANQPAVPVPPAATPTPARPAQAPIPSVSEAETISRTLLLAQRTADATTAESQAEARRLTTGARSEADSVIRAAHAQAAQLLEEAKAQARQAGESERLKVEGEVESLLARREFLVGDVEHLEQHIVTHRERLRDVVGSLQDIIGKAPGGLADIRRPLVSAVEATQGGPRPTAVRPSEVMPTATSTATSTAGTSGVAATSASEDETQRLVIVPTSDSSAAETTEPGDESGQGTANAKPVSTDSDDDGR